MTINNDQALLIATGHNGKVIEMKGCVGNHDGFVGLQFGSIRVWWRFTASGETNRAQMEQPGEEAEEVENALEAITKAVGLDTIKRAERAVPKGDGWDVFHCSGLDEYDGLVMVQWDSDQTPNIDQDEAVERARKTGLDIDYEGFLIHPVTRGKLMSNGNGRRRRLPLPLIGARGFPIRYNVLTPGHCLRILKV